LIKDSLSLKESILNDRLFRVETFCGTLVPVVLASQASVNLIVMTIFISPWHHTSPTLLLSEVELVLN